MKPVITSLCFVSMFVFLTSFSQCSDETKLQDKAPVNFGDVFYQKRVQAVRDLASSVTLFLPIKDDLIQANINLDSVYFKGKSAKLLQSSQNEKLYFARFITKPAYSEDLILSSDMAEEHKNKLPELPIKIPFELKSNECIISYFSNGEKRYYKITNIAEKRLKQVPMRSNNKP